MYYLYILQCNDGTFYTGITTDVARRLKEHKNGAGGHYTRSHGANAIVYVETFPARGAASKREYEIKGWSRTKKIALLS